MSRLDDLMEKYAADLTEIGVPVDRAFLFAVVKACGPAIYRKDGSFVATSDKVEMERLKQNFLIGKLGLKEGEKLDAGLAAVTKQYTKKAKHRAVLYYLLARQFKKRAVLMN